MSISQTEMPEMPETGALRVGVKQSMMTKQRSNPSKNV
jgi:hypothetical protein